MDNDRLAGGREFAHGGTDGAHDAVLKRRYGSAGRRGLLAVADELLGALDQLLDLAADRIAALGQLGQPVRLLLLAHRVETLRERDRAVAR
ncbi:MAG: hypothetical protein ACRDOA_16985 [Streptosporangiaceae bacterium]